jgi:hypothetical protein
VAVSARVATFHTSTLASDVPAATVLPSGLNATPATRLRGPVSGPPPNGLGEAGSETFHSRTLLSALPAASVLPSGLNATDSAYPVAPASGRDRPGLGPLPRRLAAVVCPCRAGHSTPNRS